MALYRWETRIGWIWNATTYVTQDEYDCLPSTKLCNNVNYWIYESDWTDNTLNMFIQNWVCFYFWQKKQEWAIDILVVWWGWWGGQYWWCASCWNCVQWWGWGWWYVKYCECYPILEWWCTTIVVWAWWWAQSEWWDSCFWDVVSLWWWAWAWNNPYNWEQWRGATYCWTWWGWYSNSWANWQSAWDWSSWATWSIWGNWGNWTWCKDCNIAWGWWWATWVWAEWLCWWAWGAWYCSDIEWTAHYYGWGWAWGNSACAWCDWWWATWCCATYYWWGGWGNSWGWCQWIVVVRYKTNGSWINATSTTWWCKYTCWDYTIHKFTTPWSDTLNIVLK